MEYLQWNELIARHFFNEENAGKEVLLYVNEDIIEELGQPYGCGIDDFVNSVKEGPLWAYHEHLCQKALQTYSSWRHRNLSFPPYIAYLACFVLAAGIHGDFAPHAYYPRLRKLLGETDNTSPLPSFDKMIDLWDDLEKWTVEDKHEELGRFVARIRGGWWKVGLPLSQTIISKDELKRLPVLFDAAGFDPSAPPSHQVMLKLLRSYGNLVFEKRTLKVLQAGKGSNGDNVLLDNLVEMVLSELEEWNGSVVFEKKQVNEKDETSICKINAGLRLCIHYDPISGKAQTSIRLKTNASYPEGGLVFTNAQYGSSFLCEEAYQGWSKKIRDEESKPVDAASFSWTNGIRLEDRSNNWIALLKGDKVRLFIPGKPEGLPGWVESNRLNRNSRFLIAVTEDVSSTVRSWGDQNCGSFQELQVTGLPQGWLLFKGDNATNSCENIDVLTIPPFMRLLLRGGVKISSGNTYLCNAPPLIVIENVLGDVEVSINEKVIAPQKGEKYAWKLPDDVETGELLKIKAKSGSDELRRTIRLAEARSFGSLDDTPWLDSFGKDISNVKENARLRGAVVIEDEDSNGRVAFTPKPPKCKRLTYIGPVLGQISKYPQEPFPEDWEPVWSLVKTGRKKWRLSCCRKNLQSIPVPLINACNIHGRKIKKWREYVWVKRKKIRQPDIPAIRKKWIEFSEAARHV